MSGRESRLPVAALRRNRRELLIGVLIVLLLIAIGVYLGSRGDTPQPPSSSILDAVTEAPADLEAVATAPRQPARESATPVEISDEPRT